MEMAHRNFIPTERRNRFSYFLETSGVQREDVVKYLGRHGVNARRTLHVTPAEAAYVNSLLEGEFGDGARLEMDE